MTWEYDDSARFNRINVPILCAAATAISTPSTYQHSSLTPFTIYLLSVLFVHFVFLFSVIIEIADQSAVKFNLMVAFTNTFKRTHARTQSNEFIEKKRKWKKEAEIYLFIYFLLCKYKYSNVFQQKVRLKMVCGRRNAHTQAITMNNEQQRRKEPSWYSFTQRHDVIKYDELNGKSFADVYPTQCTYCDSIRFHQLFIFRLSVSQCVYA